MGGRHFATRRLYGTMCGALATASVCPSQVSVPNCFSPELAHCRAALPVPAECCSPVCMYVCIYVCMCVCVCVCVCMNVCMYVCMHPWKHADAHIHMLYGRHALRAQPCRQKRQSLLHQSGITYPRKSCCLVAVASSLPARCERPSSPCSLR